MTHPKHPRRARGLVRTAGCLALALGALSGCSAGPLMVTGTIAKGDRIKFLYGQLGTERQGVIECAAAADGELIACRHLPVVLEGE